MKDILYGLVGGMFVLVLLLGGAYLLYQNGYISLDIRHKALMCRTTMGIFKKEAKGYSKFCNGYSRRVFRVKESQWYSFSLESEGKKGSIFGEILDERKGAILSIENQGQAQIYLTKGERYYLQIRYKDFSGRHVLRWSLKDGE